MRPSFFSRCNFWTKFVSSLARFFFLPGFHSSFIFYFFLGLFSPLFVSLSSFLYSLSSLSLSSLTFFPLYVFLFSLFLPLHYHISLFFYFVASQLQTSFRFSFIHLPSLLLLTPAISVTVVFCFLFLLHTHALCFQVFPLPTRQWQCFILRSLLLSQVYTFVPPSGSSFFHRSFHLPPPFRQFIARRAEDLWWRGYQKPHTLAEDWQRTG